MTGDAVVSSDVTTPIVLVHGVGLDHHMWDPLVALLQQRGHRIITYDLLGHGDSPALSDGAGIDSLVGQLDVVVSTAATGQVVLIGFSLGALVAQAFALQHSDRLLALVLCNSVFDRSPAERDAIIARVVDVRNGGYVASIEPALERWFTPAFAAREPDVVDSVRRRLHANVDDVASYANAYQVFAMADADLAERVAEIAVPTLVVTAADDARSTPAMTTALADRLPLGRAVILPDLRHLAPLEDPVAFAVVIDAFIHDITASPPEHA